MKKWIRNWLGLPQLEKKLEYIQNDLSRIGNHMGIWDRIIWEAIKSDTIRAKTITASKIGAVPVYDAAPEEASDGRA